MKNEHGELILGKGERSPTVIGDDMADAIRNAGASVAKPSAPATKSKTKAAAAKVEATAAKVPAWVIGFGAAGLGVLVFRKRIFG